MQDQLTGSTGSLQQQQGNLQTNSPNLQQSGTPTSTLNTSNVLSEAAPRNSLQVSTSTSSTPSTVQQDTVQAGGNTLWLLLLVIPVILVASLLWNRTEQLVTEIEQEPEEAPIPKPKAVPAKTSPKPKKKSKKTKKSGRR